MATPPTAWASAPIGSHREGEGPIHLGKAAQFGLAQAGDVLDPAESLLDALADVLAGSITRVPRRPPADRRAPAAGVLRHVRAHVQTAQFLDKVGRIMIGAATVGLFGFLYFGMVDTAIS
jgi:hypothetical protein